MNVEIFEWLLKHYRYDPTGTEFLINGFRHGFELSFREDRNTTRNVPNLKLENGADRKILWNKLMKEVKAGRYTGPFENPPFGNFIKSPIALVPKSNSDWRLIFHLSYL